jgi:hypothetical protein
MKDASRGKVRVRDGDGHDDMPAKKVGKARLGGRTGSTGGVWKK